MNIKTAIFLLTFTGYLTVISSEMKLSQFQILKIFLGNNYYPKLHIVATVPIDGDCDNGRNVCDSNLICVGGKCKCEIAKPDNSGCLVRIGGKCSQNEDCVSFLPGNRSPSSCVQGQCQCDNDKYTRNYNFTKCLEKRTRVNQQCEDPRQCTEGTLGQFSQCREGKCNCTEKAVSENDSSNTEDKCYLLANRIGDSCKVDVQCQNLKANCKGNPSKCECGLGYKNLPNNSLCVETRNIQESCEYDVQCIDPNTKCLAIPGNATAKLCLCNPSTHVLSRDGKRCLQRTTDIGGPCSEDGQCMQNSVCQLTISSNLSGNCACKNGFTANKDNKLCLQLQFLDGNCIDDNQCKGIKGEAGCTSECQCNKSKYVSDLANGDISNCWPIVAEINKPCQRKVSCLAGLGDLSICRNNICQCDYFYKYFNGKCYIPSNLGQPCNLTEQCITGINMNSYCVLGTKRCGCRPLAREVAGKCYTNKKVGDICERSEECEAWILGGHSYCDTSRKVCDCKTGFKSSGMLCSSGVVVKLQYYFIVTCLAFLKFSFTD